MIGLVCVYSDVSRNSEISIQSYLRTEEPQRGSEGQDDMGNDIFMGGIKFTPDFDSMSTQDQWYDIAGGAGKLLIGVSFQPSTVRVLPSYHHLASGIRCATLFLLPSFVLTTSWDVLCRVMRSPSTTLS